MSEAFDPYYVWLGIPPDQQPPHHYRLLGVSIFESDLDVISIAADRQMSHVRKYQIGANAAASQRILNELATARRCLLDPQAKTAYDQQLRHREAKPAGGRPQPAARTATGPARNHKDQPATAVLPADSADDYPPGAADRSPEVATVRPSDPQRLAALKRKPAWLLALASASVGVVLCGVVVAIAFGLRGGDDKTAGPASTNSTATTTPVRQTNGNDDGSPAADEHLAGTGPQDNRQALVQPDGSSANVDEPPATTAPAVPREFAPPVSPAKQRGLVGRWPFDGDARDATGHGYDAVFRKSPTYAAGPVGQAAMLAQNYFDLDQTMLDNAGQFTLATWVYLTRPTQIMLRQLGGEFLFSGGSVSLTVSKDNVQLFLIDVAGKPGAGEFRHTENWPHDFTPHIDRWTHVAVAYDQQAGQVECWIDGRSLGRRATPNYPVRIANARFMMISGGVDDMRLYDVLLTGDAIKELVAGGNAAVVTKLETPKPVPPAPRPAPPTKTFDTSGLADAVTLPPVDDTAPVKLGDVPADAATQLTLTLLGGDEAIKGSPLVALGDAEEGNAAAGEDGDLVWPVSFSEDAAAFTPVGEFRRHDGQLSFHWTAAAVEHMDAAALRNCLLGVSAAGRQHVMRLREPVVVPPLEVDLVRTIHQAKIKLDDPPPVDEIYIELGDIRVNFPGAPALTDTQRLIPLKGGQQTLDFGNGTKLLRLTVVGNASSGIVVSLKTDFMVTTMNEPQAYTKGNISKVGAPISKGIDKLTVPIAKLRAERRRTFYLTKSREIDRQLSVLEPQLATLERAKQELLQLSSAYDVLHQNSKLHFRLKYAVGNFELILAESRDGS